MSLDFCIAPANERDTAGPVVFSLPVEVHTALFSRPEDLRDCPLVRRLEDFYKDEVFTAGGELNQLLRELERAAARFADLPQVQTALLRLFEVCKQASSQGDSVYAFPD